MNYEKGYCFSLKRNGPLFKPPLRTWIALALIIFDTSLCLVTYYEELTNLLLN